MSGSLRVLPCRTPPQKADHVDIASTTASCLRLRDPRPLRLACSGPPPIRRSTSCSRISARNARPGFRREYLFAAARGRKLAARDFLMNARVLAGVGNHIRQ